MSEENLIEKHEKALKTVGLSVFTVLFLFHDVYNPLNNRYDAKTEIEKLEKWCKSGVNTAKINLIEN